MNDPDQPKPPAWAIVLAFAIVYLAWGTTYLAIHVGVEKVPPALFGGTRIALAGFLLLAFLGWRGESLRLPGRELFWAGVVGILLFVGGNYLVNLAEVTLASGVTAVLIGTTPLWMGLLELVWPWGEHLGWRAWLGLLTGFGGVILMFAPSLADPAYFVQNYGPALILASSFLWALGSFLFSRLRRSGSHLVTAGYQMVIGGLGQTFIGLALGEAGQLNADSFSLPALWAYFHLLIFGSLMGFVAYSWLLKHVSVAQAGTYAYVNPVVAIIVGWLFADEAITPWVAGGMVLILTGVALVRLSAGK